MNRPISDYVALALIGKVGDPADIFNMTGKNEFQGNWAELKSEAEERCGFQLSEQIIRDAVRSLAECNLVRVSEDRYAGEFVKVYPREFPSFVKKAGEENTKAIQEDDVIALLTRPSDYPNASALSKHPVFEDYSELGDGWLLRALTGLRQEIEEAGSLAEYIQRGESKEVPASDRVVRFTDNQIQTFDIQTSELIIGVEALNSLSDRNGLRELIVGQLKAGRELIRSGCVKVYLIQVTLIDTLNFLAKRYEHDAIGALASTLAVVLAKHLGLEI